LCCRGIGYIISTRILGAGRGKRNMQKLKLTKEERVIEKSLEEFVPVSRSHFKKLFKSIKQMKQIQKGKLKPARVTKFSGKLRDG